MPKDKPNYDDYKMTLSADNKRRLEELETEVKELRSLVMTLLARPQVIYQREPVYGPGQDWYGTWPYRITCETKPTFKDGTLMCNNVKDMDLQQ